jgi:2-polyprenyl-3-methyl-5-hydroxy-6-metoxy-1,4-benzoquinol methylase
MSGEQHVVTSLADVRRDHLQRYRWAQSYGPGLRIIDAATGCGYGAAMLADAGAARVFGFDINERALMCAVEHWSRPGVTFERHDLMAPELPPADMVVSFETVEHLPDPRPFLKAAAKAAPVLLASVPNQAVVPFSAKSFPFHVQHFTKSQLRDLLRECGWEPVEWFGQKTKTSKVRSWKGARTLLVQCRRA